MKPRPRSTLHPCLRLAFLSATTFAGLAAVPTHGADATLGRDRAPVAITSAEVWSLRPTQVSLAVQPALRPVRGGQAATIPEARRSVRMVYPALVEAR
ncbi:hypothetical protein U8607_23765 [Methylobacterium durans]|uniref:hypothetical protein n=1 Tax=Methylobacterium durans TaxID=2202825 RepID=UPI002AFF22F6|nr:hypothetical protein [Methylobacterium durans]MEA1835111.1 hypothetical protein [Methylobacterium durans]